MAKGGRVKWVVGLVYALTVGAVLLGCASRRGPVSSMAGATTITESEIDSAHAATAYDVIHKLRPQFLISRGKLSLDTRVAPALPRIYLDDQFYGDAAVLRGISTSTIESIRYYSAADAQYKYGHDNAAGVIAITTKH
jgi:hypothetical protein